MYVEKITYCHYGSLASRACLTLTASMMTSLSSLRQGLSLSSSVLTSQAVQVKLSLENGQLVSASFDLPDDRLDIIRIE